MYIYIYIFIFVKQISREINHENIVHLEEVIIEPKERSIAIVFDYSEYDLLVILIYQKSTFFYIKIIILLLINI